MITTSLGKLFLWAGMIVTHPNESLYINQTEAELWFSDRSAFEVKSLNGGVVLQSKKTGKFFSSGLNVKQKKLTPILSLSQKDFQALKKCFHLKELTWSESSFFYPQPDSNIKHCSFKTLKYSSSSPSSKDSLIQKEKLLALAGVRIHQSYWKENKRHLKIWGQQAVLKDKVSKILADDAHQFHLEFLKSHQPGNSIHFKITLFEASQHEAEQMGIHWPQSLSYTLKQGTQILQAPASGDLTNSLSASAQFSLQKGIGKILAQPVIRAQPGVEASFQSGGEIPIKNHSSFHSQTIWKNYGLSLKLKPEAELIPGAPELGVHLSLELSEPDPSTAINGVPGMIKRSIQNHFTLRTDQSTLLSSLMTLKKGRNKNGVSLLSHLPLIGYFFHTQNHTHNSTKLYIAIKANWEDLHFESIKKEEFHAFKN